MAQNPRDKEERNEQSADKFGQSQMRAEAQQPAKAGEGSHSHRLTQNAAGQVFAQDPEGNAEPIPNADVPDPIDRLKTSTSFGNTLPGAGEQTGQIGPERSPAGQAGRLPAAPVAGTVPDPSGRPAVVGAPETKAERQAREAAEAAEQKAEQKAATMRQMAAGVQPPEEFIADLVEEKAQFAGANKAAAEKTLLVEKITEATYLRRLLVAAMMRGHPFLRVGADVMLRAEKQDVQISRNDDGSVTVALVAVVA